MIEQPSLPPESPSSNLENPPSNAKAPESSREGTTDRKVLAVLEVNMLPVARKGHVQGWDNFEASRHLPEELRDPEEEDRPVTPVIATTHHTDNDVPMTMLRLGRKIKAGVASFATNQQGKYYGRLMNSRQGESIFNVNNYKGRRGNQGFLNPENFQQMANAVHEGTAVILSSYAPHYEGYGDRELPEDPGVGAVITANLSDRVVLPVVINWQGKGRFGLASDLPAQFKSYIQNKGRPRADMNIAEPIFLDRDIPAEYRTTKEEVEQAFKLFSSESRRSLSAEEIDAARQIWAKLKKQAEFIMRAQAEVSQPASQGAWRDSLAEESIEHAPNLDVIANSRATASNEVV